VSIARQSTVPSNHSTLRSGATRVEDEASPEISMSVRLEIESGYDAKVVGASFQSSEKVRVVVSTGIGDTPVG